MDKYYLYYRFSRPLSKSEDINTCVEIKEEEYKKYKQSFQSLESGLDIEVKFEFIISNFLELEHDLFELTVNSKVRNLDPPERIVSTIVTLNRRVVNILTSTRLYIDQVARNVCTCLNTDEVVKEKVTRRQKNIKKEVKAFFSEEYDSCFEYRFMEAMRNHVQHYGLPINLLARPFMLPESQTVGKSRFMLFSEKNAIKSNRDFKSQIIDEMPEKVDLIPAIRIYINSLSKVHNRISIMIEEDLDKARETIENIFSKSDLEGKEDIKISKIYLEHCSSEKPRSLIERVTISLSGDNARRKLKDMNKNISRLDKLMMW